jgi:crotonobetainyl-CoA:carnitine CoA-transferase CaiB-like acyl-CoA transferase
MERAGVPCGPINTLERVFADPHVKARGLRVDIPHAQYGSVPSVANPIRLSKTPLHYQQAPPQLGEHNELVLQNLLGLSKEEVRRLQEAGIL